MPDKTVYELVEEYVDKHASESLSPEERQKQIRSRVISLLRV